MIDITDMPVPRPVNYEGYIIFPCCDGTFDLLKDGEIVDGGFESIEMCKQYIAKINDIAERLTKERGQYDERPVCKLCGQLVDADEQAKRSDNHAECEEAQRQDHLEAMREEARYDRDLGGD